MDLNDVIDEMAERLRTLQPDTLRTVYDHPTDQVTAPAAVVPMADDITYDAAYVHGMDRMTVPVIVLVAKPDNRASRRAIAPFTATVKAALESGTTTAFDDLRVARAEFDVVNVGGPAYLAVVFTCEIVGSGSS